jgi:hypothetical protein
MTRKKLPDCKYFFLDSGVIMDKFRIDLTHAPENVKRRIEQTNNFFAALNDPFQYGGQKKFFQVSAISLAELFHLDNHHEKTVQAVIEAFDGQNLEILTFDHHTAAFHNKEFYNLLSKNEIAQIKKAVNYPVSQYSNIEDRIRKDIMIAASAKMYNSDVVLTNDGGFKALCDRLDIFCHLFTDSDNQFITGQGNSSAIFDFNV